MLLDPIGLGAEWIEVVSGTRIGVRPPELISRSRIDVVSPATSVHESMESPSENERPISLEPLVVKAPVGFEGVAVLFDEAPPEKYHQETSIVNVSSVGPTQARE